MSEYGDNIRRISRYDQIIKKIQQAQDTADQAKKLAIAGAKGIAYLNQDTLTSSAVKGAQGVTKPNATVGGTKTAASAAAGAAGSFAAGSPFNTAASSGDADSLDSDDNTDKDGAYDIDSLLGNEADEYGKVPPAAGALDAVRKITGLYNANGRRIIPSFYDGDYIGPDNADSAYSGAADSSYISGKVWTLITGVTRLFGSTFQALMSAREAVDGTVARDDAGGNPHLNPPVQGTTVIFTTAPVYAGGTSYGYTAGPTVGIGQYGQVDCGTYAGDGAACSVGPQYGNWGDLGVTQLAWVSGIASTVNPIASIGRFVPNPFDVNVPANFADGNSILDLETATGNNVRIGPLRDGGWYVYYSDVGNNNLPVGDPDKNTVYVIKSDKVPYGFTTPNQLSTMLPL